MMSPDPFLDEVERWLSQLDSDGDAYVLVVDDMEISVTAHGRGWARGYLDDGSGVLQVIVDISTLSTLTTRLT